MPGGQFRFAAVGSDCVAVMRNLSSGRLQGGSRHSSVYTTEFCENALMSDQRTALVLGGGGITGIAWELGLLAGLAEAGVDLSSADLVVGTSAGSVVGAQLTSGDHPAFRRRIGALALAAEKAGRTPSEQERLDVIGARLISPEWPERPFAVTAVDAETGEFRTFDRSSGVPLVSAVAASCAVPGVYPPVSIGGRRYIDGGMRSAANADLAKGYDRLVVLAPIPRGS